MSGNKMAGSRLFLTMIIAATLVAAGCGQLGGTRNKGSELPEVYAGTDGIIATFAPESIPSLITTGGTYEVLLLVANKGAIDADLQKTTVTVGDTRGLLKFDRDTIEGTSLGGQLEGKASSLAGSLAAAKLIVNAKSSLISDSTETSLQATVSYSYSTNLTANVCIDASAYSFQKQRKPCDAKVPIVLKSQGAPVAVKKIETLTEKYGGFVKPKFKIFIGDVGGGSVNIIYVNKVELNDKPLTCLDEDPKDSKGITKTLSDISANDFILCSYEANDFADGSGTFATPLKVELSYGYTSTSAPVPVKVEKGFGSGIAAAECASGETRKCELSYDVKGKPTGSQTCISGKWGICTA